MSRPIITVDRLAKAYRIGLKDQLPDTLVSAVAGFAKSPLRKFQQLRRLNTFTADGDAPDIVWALRDVSFEVQEGEVLGVIGRNGAGKSTLLKILSRITEPTRGRAVLRGRVSSLLEVGTGFHPELTGRDNVYMNGTILGMTKREIDAKFDEIVDFSGVERFLDTPIKRYSSGMTVRLAFAVAAHLEPEILIVDEVLAVGDAEFQKKCMGKMQDVARGGRTVLFVSHNMAAVRSLCRTGVWLYEGKVRATGATFDVINDYLRQYYAQSTGAIDLGAALRIGQHGSRLKLQGAHFNDGADLVHGEPLRVALDFEATAPIRHASFGVAFSHMDGSRILTVDSDIPGDRFEVLPTAHGRVSLTIPELQLEPGTYLVDFGARDGDGALDYIAGIVQISVIPGAKTPAIICMRNGRSGGMRIPGSWTFGANGAAHSL
jgi:lipopolysaccharide transport system ATP-binding protein